MGTMMTLVAAFSGANVLLLLGLGAVWVRNYRTFRSGLVLGLLAFASVMLVENLAAVYFFFSMDMLYASGGAVQRVVAVLRGLQFLALVFLTYVTMR